MNKTLMLMLGFFAVFGLIGAVAQDNTVVTTTNTQPIAQEYRQIGQGVYSKDPNLNAMIPGGTYILETATERLLQERKTAMKLLRWSDSKLWDITTNQFVKFPDTKDYSTNDIQIIDGHFVLVGFDYNSIPSNVKLYNLE